MSVNTLKQDCAVVETNRSNSSLLLLLAASLMAQSGCTHTQVADTLSQADSSSPSNNSESNVVLTMSAKDFVENKLPELYKIDAEPSLTLLTDPSWCTPCRIIEPFQILLADIPGIDFTKIILPPSSKEITEEPFDLINSATGISYIPSLLFCQGGECCSLDLFGILKTGFSPFLKQRSDIDVTSEQFPQTLANEAALGAVVGGVISSLSLIERPLVVGSDIYKQQRYETFKDEWCQQDDQGNPVFIENPNN